MHNISYLELLSLSCNYSTTKVMVQQHINLKKNALRKPFKNFRVKNAKPALILPFQRNKSRQPIMPTRLSEAIASNEPMTWEAARVLAFLNAAQTPHDISNGKIKNYSKSEKGYTIGNTVAERIIEKRDSLAPFGQFRSLEELKNIQGFGADKFQDLLQSMSMTANQFFYDQLFESLLYDNWEVNYHDISFRSASDFEKLVQHSSNLIAPVSEKVKEIAITDDRNLISLADQQLQQSYIEHFESPEQAAIAFAFWFYKFDEDNWFSLEQMLEKTRTYFNYNADYQHRLELYLFKGFPNGLILANGITADDLPVVVNYAEQKITIWTAALYD